MENLQSGRPEFPNLSMPATLVMFLRSAPAFVALLLILFVSCSSQEQYTYSAAAEKDFNNAIALFKEGEFHEALNIFDKLITRSDIHQRTTASYIMAAKTHYRLKEFNQSVQLLQELLANFPETAYRNDAHYSLGVNDVMLQRYGEAATEFILTIEASADPVLVQKAEPLLKTLVINRLEEPSIDQLMSGAQKRETKDLLALVLAERFFRRGDLIKARQYVDGVLKTSPPGKYESEARALASQLSTAPSVKVGILLPLTQSSSSNSVKTLAEEMLEGINVALNEYNRSSASSVKVAIEVRDTERDSVSVQKIVKELAGDHEVVALVGPVFSDIAAKCAPVANAEKIPMISPTATGKNIASSGPYVFQVAPDIDSRGKAMARYAVKVLGYTTLATLTPDEPSSRLLSESFSIEARRLGAAVIASELYVSDTTDLRGQLLNIRKAGITGEPLISFAGRIPRTELAKILHAGADPELIDSIRARDGSIGVTKLFGPRGRRIADSLNLKIIMPDKDGENTDIPVVSIQGIFAPILNADQIGIVSSQVKFFNLQTQLLGNSEWDDPSQLEAHRRDTDGIIFASDYFVEKEDSAYNNFVQLHLHDTKKQPTRYSVLGYDTMMLLLHGINLGAADREKIATALSNLEGYAGVHSTISLNHGRINSYLHILRYIKGEINNMGEISGN